MRVNSPAMLRRIDIPNGFSALRHGVLVAAFFLLLCQPAHAQLVCAETAPDQFSTGCDMRYKNTELMCPLKTTSASCPAQPMPMKDTKLKSLIKDFTPYLYAYARDPEERSRPYVGTYYRGTVGDAGQTFNMIGKPGKGTKSTGSCKPQLKFKSAAKSSEEEAKMVRMELDNCTNQYILNAAIYPQQKEASLLLSGENPANGAERISLQSHCQPLNTQAETTQEYFASDYLKAAWIKMLQDPKHRKNKKAKNEPHLPDGLVIEHPIPPPSPFPDVRLSQIASVKFEEINDPTHPFSPRWDFEFNERDHYSPKTKDYGGDEKNGVFCAGDKNSKIIKVDILAFREASLKFDDKITKRIDFNKNCMANIGPQANPCCKPNFFDGTCKLQPCAKCYGMTATAPVCATDYLTTPDRKKVKLKYIPVHQALRVAGALNSIGPAALSKLNSATGGLLNVGQTAALLSSQVNLMSALPGNLPFSKALPLLNGQLSLMNALPSSLKPQLLQQALKGQLNLLSVLPGDLPIAQVQGLLNGQVSVLSAAGKLSGLPVNQVLSTIQSPQALLNGIVAQTPIGDAQRLLNQQVRMAENLVRQGMSVTNSLNNITTQLDQLERMTNETSLRNAISNGLTKTALDGIPLDSTVGELKNLLRAQEIGLRGLDPTRTVSQFTSALSSQINVINQLPRELNVGQVSNMLGSVQGAIRDVGGDVNGIINQTGIGDLTSTLNSQLRGISSLPSNLLSGELNNLLGAQSGLVKGLTGGISGIAGQIGGAAGGLSDALNIGQVTSVLNGQLGALKGIAGDLPINQVSDLLKSQLGGLSGLAGNLKLGDIAGGLDAKILGSIPGLNGKLNLASIPGLDLSKLASQLPKVDLQNLLKGIPGMNSATIKNILSGKLSLSSIPGINAALAKLPNLNTALAKLPGMDKLLNGIPGLQVDKLPLPVVLAALPAMAPNPRAAKCQPNELAGVNSTPMAKLCTQLRAPYTGLNKLKMRYHNPDDPSTMAMKDGVPEGYTFKEYFGSNMPYPRLWDTGSSIQRTPSTVQNPQDDSGQYTAIVGIGHEGTPEPAAAPAAAAPPVAGAPAPAAPAAPADRASQAAALKKQDQRCLYGGWGEDVTMGGVSVKLPDPIASWTELKLYQARTLRDLSLSCLARYEKSFKLGGSENMALSALGAQYARGIVTLPNGAGGYDYKSITQFKADPASGTIKNAIMQMKQEGWPLAWRGYMSAKKDDQRFPNFSKAGSTKTGLSNAQPGDIILMPEGTTKPGGKPGLPKVAIVTDQLSLPGGGNCQSEKNCFIKVIEADNGKWPDVCGTTDSLGEMKTRHLYMPGMLPKFAREEYDRIKSDGDCADTGLAHCEAKNWNELKLYRPREDLREGPAIPAPATAAPAPPAPTPPPAGAI